ncbi:MAG: hypothetical protein LIP77_07625 [Planctomycetes bacterium]|nr:hypothetical protein [Planctomycetota bacterium]
MVGVALGAGAADIPGLIRQARSYNPDVNIEMEMTMLRPPEMAAEAVVAWEAEQVKQSAGYLFGCLAEKDQKEKGDSNESGLY